MTDDFVYSNLSGRRRGPVLRIAGTFYRGIARVQDDVEPFGHAWERDNRAALASGEPIWVALGDSMTQGIGAPAHDRGWVGQLRDRLARDGRELRVVNLAVSGARTSDVLERQLPALEGLGVEPALVTLMIGSNDLIRPKNRRGVVARFAAILDRLPPGTVVCTLPNPSRVVHQINATIERVAGERGLVVADLRDRRTTSWRGKLADDHFHPNELGYSSLADVVEDAMRRSG